MILHKILKHKVFKENKKKMLKNISIVVNTRRKLFWHKADIFDTKNKSSE